MEVYEVLDDIRYLQKETIAFVNTMKSWMSNEEIQEFEKLKKRFSRIVSQYEEECLNYDICPNCGSELITKNYEDKECGSYSITRCIECQMAFD
jgi:predicted RNA-binding Zn-ribbon protein involved in translation (DUF1610 family)